MGLRAFRFVRAEVSDASLGQGKWGRENVMKGLIISEIQYTENPGQLRFESGDYYLSICVVEAVGRIAQGRRRNDEIR